MGLSIFTPLVSGVTTLCSPSVSFTVPFLQGQLNTCILQQVIMGQTTHHAWSLWGLAPEVDIPFFCCLHTVTLFLLLVLLSLQDPQRLLCDSPLAMSLSILPSRESPSPVLGSLPIPCLSAMPCPQGLCSGFQSSDHQLNHSGLPLSAVAAPPQDFFLVPPLWKY